MKEDVELDYNDLIHDAQIKAYRFLMRDVLTLVGELGDAPGEHHFFIEFITGAPGVSIPDHLKAQYPERMTIVLQHQFANLDVTDEKFGVTLWFKGKEARLEIPFAAVTQFADPSAQFGINLDAGGQPATTATPAPEQNAPAAAEDVAPEEAPDKPAKKGDGADIVSLDSFRKK